jgi:hypothetical protein
MPSVFRLLCLTVVLLVTAVNAAQGAEPFRYKEGKHGQAQLTYINDVPVLILKGSPKEIGEQTGVLAVRQAKPLFGFPRDYFLGECGLMILKSNPTWNKQNKQFKDAIQSADQFLWPLVLKKAASLENGFPESQKTELKAIADAAGKDVVSLPHLVAVNGMFDLGHVPQSELVRGCSSVIVPPQHSATKGLLFGRNLDFYHFDYLHHYSLLMVYQSNDPKKHSFASAGFPGFVGSFTGMNDAGLTIASHEVQDPDTTTLFNPKGVPFAMAYRRILEECETIGDAIKLLDSMERASVTSLVIADTKSGAVIEVTPDTLAVRRFKDKPGVCTNHFCTMKNPNLKEQFETFKRFDTLTQAVKVKKDEVFGVADIQKGMHAVRLLDGDKIDMTIQTFVFEPSERKVHLRFSNGTGPATAGKLSTIDLNKLWAK